MQDPEAHLEDVRGSLQGFVNRWGPQYVAADHGMTLSELAAEVGPVAISVDARPPLELDPTELHSIHPLRPKVVLADETESDVNARHQVSGLPPTNLQHP
jgi:hypothetical protein